jgi:hypothetical protein
LQSWVVEVCSAGESFGLARAAPVDVREQQPQAQALDGFVIAP